jgi:hypothetical protein
MIDLVTQFKDRRPGARPAAARLGLRGARRGGAPMLPCPIARRRVNTAYRAGVTSVEKPVPRGAAPIWHPISRPSRRIRFRLGGKDNLLQIGWA